MKYDYPKRRIFITNGGVQYKIFDFIQNKNDGSIYVSSPNFPEIKWIAISAGQSPNLIVLDSPGDGKLSLHASGMVGIGTHSTRRHELVVYGNYLLDSKNRRAGLRHLFTMFMAEPKELPVSPAFNRATDYSINKTGRLSPFVMIFFAVPRTSKLTLAIEASLDIDDLETVPPDSGGGLIELAFHSVAWFAYKTKNMNRWPKHPHICYYDGYTVPMFIGTGEGKCRLELRNPSYELTETQVFIKL